MQICGFSSNIVGEYPVKASAASINHRQFDTQHVPQWMQTVGYLPLWHRMRAERERALSHATLR